MLVLSRKKNEAILINDEIEIVVVEIRGDKVRLGINAPQKVPVHRREVYDAIKREQAASAIKAAENGSGYGWAAMSGTSMDATVSQVEEAVIQVPMPPKPELKWGGEYEDHD